MRPPARALALLSAAALMAACETAGPTAAPEPSPDPSAAETLPAPEATVPEATAPNATAAGQPAAPTRPAAAVPIPHIYLALQPGNPGHAHSAVFAIDRARDGTPSDDPAIRLTPEGGRCNPQEMRRYDFPADAAPTVSEAEQSRGLTARDLPAYLAAQVTGRMIETGLAAEPEDTRPLNVCTRKLWERLVVAGNREALAAGQ